MRLRNDQEIEIFAPATVANLGPGFDIMGMAIEGAGDRLLIQVRPGDSLSIRNESEVSLPSDIEKNVITPALRAMLQAWGGTLAIEIVILQKIRPGSGIGSSSASSAAAVVGLNELLGRPFGEKELITFAMEGERLVSGGTAHADNAGPAIAGGILLIRGYDPLDYIRIPVPARLCTAVIHPHITVNTLDSRAVMRREIPQRDAVTQWGNVGGLVAGLLTADMGLIGRSLKDVIAEPYRKHFIPGYDPLKAALARTEGVLGSNIAGSGPSVFALCDGPQAAAAAGAIMTRHFGHLGIEADLYVGPVAERGAYVIR
ncbi:homoserine kinase [uncultured Rikenella sp.]|uniref:homoserine kinase n=1 Tax=uncultured Rikenella sp. TaxID=368003 RepID=UPI00262B4B11|nr:homoserine kinase [uncultured Rikenella sp.]